MKRHSAARPPGSAAVRGVVALVLSIVGASGACARGDDGPLGVGPSGAPTLVDAGTDSAPPTPSATVPSTPPPPAGPAPAPPPPPAPPPVAPLDAGAEAGEPTVNARPELARIEPAWVAAGTASLTLTVHGRAFVPQALVLVGGTAVTTRFLGPSLLEADLAAHPLAEGGEVAVEVRNPSPGGGVSGAVYLVVEEEPPLLLRLEPARASVGSGPLRVSARGARFDGTSLVRVDGVPVTTALGSPDHLTFELTAPLLAAPRTLSIDVLSFGAEASAAVPFEVQ